MGRILWVLSFDDLRLNYEEFQSPDQWGGYCGTSLTFLMFISAFESFNPLTNGADIVGPPNGYLMALLSVTFQSPDQWGGYCGLRLGRLPSYPQ